MTGRPARNWSRRARSSCEWDLMADGQLAGTLAFVPTSDLQHAALAEKVLSALNVDAAAAAEIAPPDASYRAAGWRCAGDYHRQVNVVRDFVGQFPPEAREQVRASWERAEMPYPMNREQMGEWQNTVLSVLTAYTEQQDPA